ncbi:TPA: DNA ligase LigA-related protein [Photobacterium damselae]
MSPAQAAELIKRRRAQMLVHSCIYYELDQSIISDHLWQHWANELAELQAKYPEPIGFYDEEFAGWTGDTGALLPLREPWIVSRSHHLLRYHETYSNRS